MLKIFGALLIVAGGGMFGFSLASAHRREESALRSLLSALDFMQCELQYRLTPLPDLCREAGRQTKNGIGQVFLALSQELETQTHADVARCMDAVLLQTASLPLRARKALAILGSSLGRFDVQGQILALEGVRAHCRQELDTLTLDRDARLRSYQTLGLCAGAALAILLV